MTRMEDAMSETMITKAAMSLRAEVDAIGRANLYDRNPQLYQRLARAVLMAVKELPADFTRERRAQFYNTEFLDADFESVIDAILAQEPGA